MSLLPPDLARPVYHDGVPRCAASTIPLAPAGGMDWYPPLAFGADSIESDLVGETATHVTEALELLQRLEPDAYSVYVSEFYRRGLADHGRHWRYADLVTAALVAARWVKADSYLEVGVRRGRSVCAVAKARPTCDILMFDMWMAGYAGMDNPGPDLVRGELDKVGHRGRRDFVDGDSHQTLPAWFKDHPDAYFDLINVDGDHSVEGAAQDIADVLPRLKIGGVFLFDDVANPYAPGLLEVWNELVVADPRFSTATYTSAGYGVGLAVRRY